MKSKTNKILFFIAIFSLIVLFFIEIFTHYDTFARQIALSLTCLVAIIILFITFKKIKKKFSADLPFYIAWIAALGVWFDALGNFAHFYARFLWWDKLYHAVGSAALAAAIYFILFTLKKQKKIAAVYEVSEYIGDQIFPTHRITDLYDTADDLMWDIIASLIVLLIIFLFNYYKKNKL